MATLSGNAIVTLADARVFLGYATSTATTNDGIITTMINSISQLLEIETSRKVIQQTLTGYRLDGTGRREILVPYVPLQSVSSVVINDRITDTTLYTFTSYSVTNPDTGCLMLTDGNIFPRGRNNVVLGLSVGWGATAPELSIFQQACFLQLKNDYKRWENQEVGLVQRSLPDGSVVMQAAHSLLIQVLEMVRPYKLRSCG